MSKRIGNMIIICPEENAVCELCGGVEETRPYGPNGERICLNCGEKNHELTERQMRRVLFGEELH